jgi:hypothetical protein
MQHLLMDVESEIAITLLKAIFVKHEMIVEQLVKVLKIIARRAIVMLLNLKFLINVTVLKGIKTSSILRTVSVVLSVAQQN